MTEPDTGWWNRPLLLGLLVLVSAMPLWLPSIPPLTDLPGHMGRYFIQLDAGRSPRLAHWYVFEWQWVGNLGVDALVQLLGPALGVVAATKLVVLAIPMVTAAGFLLVAREVHGRIPPTALFALPLAWNYPFLWGFVNFALSMALAFLAFALWLRLGRVGRNGLRSLIFAGLSILLWTAHIYGWATLCVLAGCAEIVRARLVHGWVKSLGRAAIACLCLLPPVGLMIWRFGAGGAGGQPFAHSWFNFSLKQRWLVSMLRDRWEWFDKTSLALLMGIVFCALLAWALKRHRASGQALGWAAAILAFLFLVMPHNLLGSAYADMRLAPYALATALLAIGPATRHAGLIALAALSFFGVRTLGTGLSMAQYDARYTAELTALSHIPVGARLVSFVGKPCAPDWAVHRLDHLPSLALIKRQAFANDQWQAEGAQLVRVRYAAAGAFRSDPSQFVVEPRCERRERMAISRALSSFPRDAFDYVWIVQQPDGPVDLSGLDLVWTQGRSSLYRVLRTK